LNPLVVVAVVNGGHSDALVGLGVLAGVVLVVHRRPWLGGVVLGLAALVKIVALLPLAAVAGWVLFRPRGVRVAAAVAVAGVLVVGCGYAAAGGRVAVRPLSEARLNVSSASPWNPVRVFLTERQIAEGERGEAAGLEARRRVALGVDFAVLAVGLVLVLGRRRDTSPALVAGGAAFAYLLLGAYVLPWYAAWATFVMALKWRSPLTWVVVAQGALLQLAYVSNPRTGGTIFPAASRGLAESAELALRQSALPIISVALAVAVMISACFASSRSTSGTLTAPGPSGGTRSSRGSTG
jgi:alpha-1,6-mannosyltransferase